MPSLMQVCSMLLTIGLRCSRSVRLDGYIRSFQLTAQCLDREEFAKKEAAPLLHGFCWELGLSKSDALQ